MKKLSVFIAVLLVISSIPALAADKKVPEKTAIASPAQAPSAKDQEKQQLIANLQGMQTLELRVVVLQQLLNREVGELKQAQAVFCDMYKLDVEKWRKGVYRYDEKLAKFIESPEPKTAN